MPPTCRPQGVDSSAARERVAWVGPPLLTPLLITPGDAYFGFFTFGILELLSWFLKNKSLNAIRIPRKNIIFVGYSIFIIFEKVRVQVAFCPLISFPLNWHRNLFPPQRCTCGKHVCHLLPPRHERLVQQPLTRPRRTVAANMHIFALVWGPGMAPGDGEIS